MEEEDYKLAANRMSQPGTFNLAERIAGRNLPTDQVTIYLNEQLGWDLEVLKSKLNDAVQKKDILELERKIEKVTKELAACAYVFTVQGMTNETYDEIVDKTDEQYPEEFDENVNALTGVKVRTPIENAERLDLFNRLLMEASLVKVVDPDGNVDEDLDLAKVTFISRQAPWAAVVKLRTKIAELRMTTAWMDEIQNEDFSQRP